MLPGELSVPRTYIRKHPERSYDASVYETKPPHFIEEIRTPSKILKKKKTYRSICCLFFYSELNHLYENHGLKDSEKSSFVYNCDESGFGSDPTRVKATK